MYGPRPQAEVRAFKTKGKVFLDMDQPRLVNNIYFLPLKFAKSNFSLTTDTEHVIALSLDL